MDWEQMGMNHNPSFSELKAIVANQSKPHILYHIGKDEILNKDLKGVDNFIKNVKKIGKPLRQRCSIFCGGYDDVADELFEIPEVREFVELMFKKHPYLFYYIEIEFMQTNKWIMSCLADELTTVTTHERKSVIELEAEYGFDNLPRLQSHLVFKDNKLYNILNPIIKHAKSNKDVKNGKRIAYEYAVIFDHAHDTLSQLNIDLEDLQ